MCYPMTAIFLGLALFGTTSFAEDTPDEFKKTGWSVQGNISKNGTGYVFTTGELQSSKHTGTLTVTVSALTPGQSITIFAGYDPERALPVINDYDPVSHKTTTIQVDKGYGFVVKGNSFKMFSAHRYQNKFISTGSSEFELKKGQNSFQFSITLDGNQTEFTLDGRRLRLEKGQISPGVFYVAGTGGAGIVSIQVQGQ